MNPTSSTPPVLNGIGLSKSFGSTRALDAVDIAVGAGESVAVMGPSGSGKSTLLHCLANIERPDSGQVLLDGERIDQLREPDRSELRRTRFGFVFQFGQLLPELPAVENVAIPLMLGGMTRREAERNARQWFAPLGLEGKEDSRPGQLSGGQAQRVAIARARGAGAGPARAAASRDPAARHAGGAAGVGGAPRRGGGGGPPRAPPPPPARPPPPPRRGRR
ncbi:ABC transporter ATP-binding protein [Streptomyces mirabilis]